MVPGLVRQGLLFGGCNDRSYGAFVGLGPGDAGRLLERQRRELPVGKAQHQLPLLPLQLHRFPLVEAALVALGSFTL